MNRSLSLSVAIAVMLASSACEKPRAQGDQNAFIVGASTEVWDEVQDVFRDAMEPTIQTVRNERPFRITHQDPAVAEDWGLLSRFRQVLVLGFEADPWIQQALEEARENVGPAPALVQVTNVWALGQTVSVLLLPETGRAQAVQDLAPRLHDILDEQFRRYAVNRMFVTGADTVLRDSLAENVGFSVVVPEVYDYTSTADSVFRFRNDNPSPQELIREIVVTWISPIPDADPTAGELRSWREDFSATYYNDPQVVDTMLTSYNAVEVDGLSGVEYQAAWVSPPGAWPAGGPFITRALRCPSQDRLYFTDGWVYAPNQDKYQFMIQLETVLDSFRCH